MNISRTLFDCIFVFQILVEIRKKIPFFSAVSHFISKGSGNIISFISHKTSFSVSSKLSLKCQVEIGEIWLSISQYLLFLHLCWGLESHLVTLLEVDKIEKIKFTCLYQAIDLILENLHEKYLHFFQQISL